MKKKILYSFTLLLSMTIISKSQTNVNYKLVRTVHLQPITPVYNLNVNRVISTPVYETRNGKNVVKSYIIEPNPVYRPVYRVRKQDCFYNLLYDY